MPHGPPNTNIDKSTVHDYTTATSSADFQHTEHWRPVWGLNNPFAAATGLQDSRNTKAVDNSESVDKYGYTAHDKCSGYCDRRA